VEWQGAFGLAIFSLAVIWFGLYYQRLTFLSAGRPISHNCI